MGRSGRAALSRAEAPGRRRGACSGNWRRSSRWASPRSSSTPPSAWPAACLRWACCSASASHPRRDRAGGPRPDACSDAGHATPKPAVVCCGSWEHTMAMTAGIAPRSCRRAALNGVAQRHGGTAALGGGSASSAASQRAHLRRRLIGVGQRYAGPGRERRVHVWTGRRRAASRLGGDWVGEEGGRSTVPPSPSTMARPRPSSTSRRRSCAPASPRCPAAGGQRELLRQALVA
jgi:hypothetical protein